MRLMVKIPTRQRPEKFKKVFQQYYDLRQHKGDFTQFLITCDTDDESMNNQEMIEWINSHKNTTLTFGEHNSKIEAINDMKGQCNWDIVLLASDDMIPQIQGYDEIIRLAMKSNYPDYDGVLWFYDGYRQDLNTLVIMGAEYYNRFGYIYHPSYKSVFCDDEMMTVAMKLMKQTYIPLCIIKHEHQIWKGEPMDELAKKNDKYYNADMAIFQRRKMINFGL